MELNIDEYGLIDTGLTSIINDIDSRGGCDCEACVQTKRAAITLLNKIHEECGRMIMKESKEEVGEILREQAL